MLKSSHLGLVAAIFTLAAPAALPDGKIPTANAAEGTEVSTRTRVSFDENWRFHRGDIKSPTPAGNGTPVAAWRWHPGADIGLLTAATGTADWHPATSGEDVFSARAGFAWFRATLSAWPNPDGKPVTPLLLRFMGVDDNATIFLNGHELATHHGWGQAFEVPLRSHWGAAKPNELAVLVENTTGAGGIGEVFLTKTSLVDTTAASPDYRDGNWRHLDLPHDWGIEGPFDIALPGESGKLPWSGIGWYRKRFTLPPNLAAGTRTVLEIDGAMANSKVWVNGQSAGGWAYGYSSFQVDLTPFVRPGAENVVAIRLDNWPDSSRWYPGGGLYRNIWLTQTGPVHVGQWGTQITSTIQIDAAMVSASTTLCNDGDAPRRLSLITTIQDAGGNSVATSRTNLELAPQAQSVVSAELPVPGPRTWDLKDPYGYNLVSQVMQGATILDRYVTPFGIRSIAWDANQGFSLNGKPVHLNGVCLHHDLGAIGTAVNVRALQRQLQLMQEMGCNAIRTSHNPPAPELLDLCDSMGMLVMDEFSDTWKTAKKPNGYARLFDEWAERDLRALVRRDRNHPCVISWSIGNEVGEQRSDWGSKIAGTLAGIVHSEDSTRPVSCANDQVVAGYNGFQKNLNAFGYNYKPSEYPKFHKANPDLPLFGSETSSTISSRGEYFFSENNRGDGKANFQVSSYDLNFPGWASTPDQEFRGQDANPFVAGEFVWTGFDYLGEPTPYNDDLTVLTNFHTAEERARAEKELRELGKIRIPSRSSYFGIVDLAGFKKDRYYIYQAHWRPDLPMAHILPHWNWPERTGQVTPVHVYTSGDEAELFLNGKSLGRKKKAQYEYRLRWDDVVYQPGELRVVAYKNGRHWAESTVKTTGAAAKLLLSADRAKIQTDGKDLAFVTVSTADSNGLTVPRSKNALHFTLSGPGEIVGTDNGDATDLTSFQSKDRKAFNGLALAIVRFKRGAKTPLTLTARSAGLQSGGMVISRSSR